MRYCVGFIARHVFHVSRRSGSEKATFWYAAKPNFAKKGAKKFESVEKGETCRAEVKPAGADAVYRTDTDLLGQKDEVFGGECSCRLRSSCREIEISEKRK